MFCRNPMLLYFPSQPGRVLQARQNFVSPNFCLGSLERFGAEQNQIPEFPHAYSGHTIKIKIKTSYPGLAGRQQHISA
jgi:hypothetical protein